MSLAKIKMRRGAAGEWASSNPILDEGEFGIDTSTGQFRIGNGTSRWAALLPFYPGVTGGSGGSSSGGGAPLITVASAISSSRVKARADYVCNGTNDADIINAAILAADNQINNGNTGPRHGSLQLADGVYVLNKPILIPGRGFSLMGCGFGTALMKASTFTNGGRGSAEALIKMANTLPGNQAGCITIKDMFLAGRHRANFGAGAPSGTPIKGIHLEITPGDAVAAMSDPTTYGWPTGGPNESDNHSILENLRIWDTAGGIFVSDTTGARGFQYKGIMIGRLTSGAKGLHSNASDSKTFQCVVASGGATNATGIHLDGGNGLMLQCKAFYFNASGSLGFNVSSSRCTLVLCESQDNLEGFRVTGDNAEAIGCRVDTQVASTIGFNLNGASSFNIEGLAIHTRGPGTLTNGLCLPNATTVGDGKLSAYIDPIVGGGVAKPVTVGPGFTEVVASSGIPTGIEALITVKGKGTLRRELAYTH
jgi:hypothetical protein